MKVDGQSDENSGNANGKEGNKDAIEITGKVDSKNNPGDGSIEERAFDHNKKTFEDLTNKKPSIIDVLKINKDRKKVSLLDDKNPGTIKIGRRSMFPP